VGNFTGKIIAKLNLSFWVNICSKKYSPLLWSNPKLFKAVFVNYPKSMRVQIHEISKTLQYIKNLRNRIFHFEPIYKKGSDLLTRYNEILTIINYLPTDEYRVFEYNCRFKDVYNSVKIKTQAPK